MKVGSQKPLIARAFEIAAECYSSKTIRQQLLNEGYSHREVEAHFLGAGLRRQLKALVRSAPTRSRPAPSAFHRERAKSPEPEIS